MFLIFSLNLPIFDTKLITRQLSRQCGAFSVFSNPRMFLVGDFVVRIFAWKTMLGILHPQLSVSIYMMKIEDIYFLIAY